MPGFPRHSIPGLLLVPEGQHIDRIGGRIVAVERDIAGIAEAYYQFTQLGRIRKRSARIRGCFQEQELPLDGLPRPPGSLGILVR